jgi:hypothetical protein
VAEELGVKVGTTAQLSPGAVEDKTKTEGPSRDDAPTNIDFSDCSMCQSAHQNGQFLRPTTSGFSLQSYVKLRSIELIQDVATRTPISFSWQVRAPPQV